MSGEVDPNAVFIGIEQRPGRTTIKIRIRMANHIGQVVKDGVCNSWLRVAHLARIDGVGHSGPTLERLAWIIGCARIALGG